MWSHTFEKKKKGLNLCKVMKEQIHKNDYAIGIKSKQKITYEF